MKLKKAVAIAAAAGALAAISVPAMAFENEFHGMYRAFGFMTNALSGGGAFHLAKNSETDKFIEQRARLQYIAKASDNLKLVTHFEIDTKFGGSSTTKYPIGDAGGLDADRITLETKSVYLDFNCPITGMNVKAGIQPFNDALQGVFGNFDATGVVLSKKFGNVTGTYGYFTVAQNNSSFAYAGTNQASIITGTDFHSSITATDLNVLDLKVALTKDIILGTSFYNQLFTTANTYANNTLGVNAAVKAGPVSLNGAVGYQFGKQIGSAANAPGTSAWTASLAAKIAAGPGSVRASALYLSGDRNGTGYNHGFQSVANSAAVNYFTPADMWLITRNVATINSSTAIGGSPDLNRGGRGILGAFAGYEGVVGKAFFNGNVGAAKVADKRGAASANIGLELNATIGYKLYDNLSASLIGAYAILGDGYGKDSAVAADFLPGGVRKADNPFLTAIALNYAF